MRRNDSWIRRYRLSMYQSMSAPKIIVLAFLAIILLGAGLLALPFASRGNRSCGFLTALFTATSATCVTGLSVVDTYTQWSGFGKMVILILIQVGGLGFMTVVSVFYFVLRAKIGPRSRMLLSRSFGLDEVDGVVRMVRHVLLGTLLLELAGAAVLTARFSMDQGFWTALKWGVFHSVSAFCNAGFDLLGQIAPGQSLAPYRADVTVNITIMLLIVLGGLGFVVWEDCLRARRWKRLTVYSKLVLLISGFLIVAGTAAVAAAEWSNPATLGNLPAGQKLLAALFQSVSTRTAGFASVPQGCLTEPGKVISIVLMLIGGSSGSTAGGIKTVTMGIAVLGALSALRGKNRLTVFHRTIDPHQIIVAFSLAFMMFGLSVFGAMYLCSSIGVGFLDALFETASAIGTVGLSTGVTALLNAGGELMLIAFMFFGRIGIMTIGVGFLLGDRDEGRYHYAPAKMLIG